MIDRYYLGLACSGHDNALALVDASGAVVFAEAVERPLQQKRALATPPDGIFQIRRLIEERCPEDAEIVLAKTWSDGAVAHFGELERQAREQLRQLARFDRSSFVTSDLHAFLHLLRTGASHIALAGVTAEAYLRQERGQREVTTRAYDHHLTHAAAACLTGPFEEAACLVVDGLGEQGSTHGFSFDAGRIEPIPVEPTRARWPGSLGFFFMEVCRLCGFDPVVGEEWKVMGLAAHGKLDARIHQLMRRCVAVEGLSVVRPPGALEAGAALRALGRAPGAPIMDAADLACAGQRVFTEMMAKLLRNLHAERPSHNLVLGGGCALNSAANGLLLAGSPFSRLHVFSAPADDGNAVGAALLAWREDHPDAGWAPRSQRADLGSNLSTDSLRALARGGALQVERLTPEDATALAARLLDEGQVIGWAQGRAELGPRALGHRSILADPRRAGMKERINATIKRREPFRPFAPAILHERGADYFVDYQESPFMERALLFQPAARELVPAVVHADGTGRLQSVTRERNPRLHALIRAFDERTGVPMLLNTSLNVMGRPIVHSVEDAVALFCTSGLDALFLDDHVLQKEAPT